MSAYHAFELNYLAQIYIRTYLSPSTKNQETNFVLYFKPSAEFCRQRSLNVLPDFLPASQVKLKSVTVGGLQRSGTMPANFQINLEEDELGSMIKVEFISQRTVEPLPEEAAAKTNGQGGESATCRPENRRAH